MVKRRSEDPTFWSAISDIRKLAAQRMTARERKKFQLQDKKKAGKPVKGPKIPYNILQGMKKKEKQRERTQREDAKNSGMWRSPKGKKPQGRKPQGRKPQGRKTR